MAQVISPETAGAELEKALGQVSETVAVNGQAVTVTPFRLRQFANVLKCVQRLREAGVVEDKALKAAADAETAEEAVKRFDMVKMFLAGGDEIINIVIIGSGLQAQVVDRLDLPTGVRLASAIFRVNLDFFYQNRDLIREALAPAVEAVEKVMTEGVESLGQPPSTDSEAQATA